MLQTCIPRSSEALSSSTLAFIISVLNSRIKQNNYLIISPSQHSNDFSFIWCLPRRGFLMLVWGNISSISFVPSFINFYLPNIRIFIQVLSLYQLFHFFNQALVLWVTNKLANFIICLHKNMPLVSRNWQHL